MSQADRQFDIQKIASLARITIEPTQQPTLRKQISTVLDFVGTFDELDLAAVEPFLGTSTSGSVRADEISPGLSRKETLQNAPDHDGEFFRVPPVFK